MSTMRYRLGDYAEALSLVTGPAAEPLSTADAKAHLRVDSSDENAYIDALVIAARNYVERATNRALITQTWKLTLDRFPCKHVPILLKRSPLQSVSSIVYIDGDGAEQTWSSGEYVVDAASTPGRVGPGPDYEGPDAQLDRFAACTITFIAGYGASSASIPAPLIHAIRMLVAHWFENREDVITGTIVSRVRMAVEALMAAYAVPEI